VADLCALTVAEARAILIAEAALGFSYEERLASGQTFGIEEREAWQKLVESATARIAAYERPVVAPTPYPGGNEPDVQTLFVEAAAAFETRRETIEADPPRVDDPVPDRLIWRPTKRLLHAFLVTSKGAGAWSLCGLVQFVNTADLDPALFQDRCKSCMRFALAGVHAEPPP
jgi:hypothetical protein